jgi:hypothetical protein
VVLSISLPFHGCGHHGCSLQRTQVLPAMEQMRRWWCSSSTVQAEQAMLFCNQHMPYMCCEDGATYVFISTPIQQQTNITAASRGDLRASSTGDLSVCTMTSECTIWLYQIIPSIYSALVLNGAETSIIIRHLAVTGSLKVPLYFQRVN